MNVGAVILAAGFGTRLAPLTIDTPKPLLAVGGQPVASHLLARLGQVDGLTEIVVVVNDCHLDQWHRWQSELPPSPHVHIVSNGVTENESRPGAVADLALGIRALVDRAPAVEWTFVLAGDNLLDEPLQPHLDAARSTQEPVVLCRDLGAHVPAGRFGEITVDDIGIITRFREKPANPQSPLAATCSYVLATTAIDELARFLDSGGDADSPGEFIGWLASNRPVRARPVRGHYHDIGNHQTLALARAFYEQ